jgi:hypothetical protein
MALAIAPGSGAVYIAGDTYGGGLPFTSGGAQSSVTGTDHAFVARFDPTLATAQVTYVSGSTGTMLFEDYERSGALGIHPLSGEVYVAGLSRSNDHPAVGGGAQATKNGFQDAFVTRLSPDLTTFLQSTYFGGNDRDGSRGLGFDPTSGEVYLIGHTTSTTLPGVSCGSQTNLRGLEDGFVARFNQALTHRSGATYFGGSRAENPLAGTVHPTSGEVYAVGATNSADFPATTGGANPVAGAVEAFAIRLTLVIPGDCDGDGTVSISELITGVSIAVGTSPVSVCPPFDGDGSGTVSIAELVRAVNIALSGCP